MQIFGDLRKLLLYQPGLSIGDAILRDLRRAETWSRFGILETLRLINQQHVLADFKTNRFIDPYTYAAQHGNPYAEITNTTFPVSPDTQRRKDSAAARNKRRLAAHNNQVIGGITWQSAHKTDLAQDPNKSN